MLFVVLLALLICTLDGLSLLCVAVYVRPQMAMIASLATALLGLGVLVYAWFRHFRATASFRGGRLQLHGRWQDFLLLAAAFLMIIPGAASDVLAVVLLVPAVRRAAGRSLQRRWPLEQEP